MSSLVVRARQNPWWPAWYLIKEKEKHHSWKTKEIQTFTIELDDSDGSTAILFKWWNDWLTKQTKC